MAIMTGMFNKKAIFIKEEISVTDYGGRGKSVEVELLTTYVYTSNLRNSEYWDSKRVSDKSKLRIRVRFHKKLLEINTKDCFVIIDNFKWNILSVENVFERNREFLMYLERKEK